MFPKTGIRFFLSGLFVLIAALAAPAYVFANEWAVVTLDQLPVNVIAGQPYSLGLMVRQYGFTPWRVNEIRIEAVHPKTGRAEFFTAKPDQTPGHYQVSLLFPQSGRWQWGVASGLFPTLQLMPVLDVVDGERILLFTPKKPAPKDVRTPDVIMVLLGFFALMGFATATLMVIRGRDTLPAVGLMILCAILVLFAFASTEVKQILPIPRTSGDAPAGQRLFLAKGCAVCHINDRVIEKSEMYSMNIGPDLSDYRGDQRFLRQFLADPRSVRNTSAMPGLDLAPAEIEELIIFLNHHE